MTAVALTRHPLRLTAAHRIAAVVPGLFVALIAGCARAPTKPPPPDYLGRADYHRIAEPAGSKHYRLSPGEGVIRPAPRRNPNPVYPPALVARGLPPVDVVARLSVDTVGRVTAVWVQPISDPPPWRAAFAAAVRAATATWTFSPLKFTRVTENGDAEPTLIVSAKPFSAWYRFHFDVVDGKPVSTSAARGGD